MWIMLTDPYGIGGAAARTRAARLVELNRAAVAFFRHGHVPLNGVDAALPGARPWRRS